ncbi:MAG: ATP-binding protein [Candidatus Kuenenia sp.]|nr:ATP-binding protein [Candidatus Kuenenia hertensis]
MFAREEELRLIKSVMDCGKNIIIYGEEGTGKSAVIHEIISRRKSGKVLYSHCSKTLKESLINPILFYSNEAKKINNKNIPMLRKIFFAMLDEIAPEYIIFDHVELVKPKLYSFFLYLMDKKIPLIIISRGIKKKDIDHLRMVLFDFEKMEMTN